MSKFINSFKKKSFRIGGYSFLLCLIIVAIVVVVNVFISAAPATVTKFDTTSNSLYSISEQTVNIVKNINEDVTIYFVASAGNEDITIQNLLDKYAAANSHIKIKKIDPAINPTFASKYSDKMENSSLVVESAKRYKVIANSEINTISYTEEEYYQAYYYGVTPTGTQYFAGESEITSALLYVTNDNLPVIYILSGHGEGTFNSTLLQYFDDDNIETKSLSIVSEGKIPDDASALAIISPSQDISDDEKTVINEYLDKGGKIILFSNYETKVLPNLDSITESFGIVKQTGLMVESNSAYHMSGYPYFILPEIKSSAIKDLLETTNMRVLIPYANGVSKSSNIPENKTYTSLFTSSDSAYFKQIDENTETVEYAEGDVKGTFDLGCLVKDSSSGAEIMWITSDAFLDATIDQYISAGNSTYFLTALTYLLDKPESVSIAAKSMTAESLVIPAQWAAILSIVAVFIIPIATVVTGLIIWFKRRKAQ